MKFMVVVVALAAVAFAEEAEKKTEKRGVFGLGDYGHGYALSAPAYSSYGLGHGLGYSSYGYGGYGGYGGHGLDYGVHAAPVVASSYTKTYAAPVIAKTYAAPAVIAAPAYKAYSAPIVAAAPLVSHGYSAPLSFGYGGYGHGLGYGGYGHGLGYSSYGQGLGYGSYGHGLGYGSYGGYSGYSGYGHGLSYGKYW